MKNMYKILLVIISLLFFSTLLPEIVFADPDLLNTAGKVSLSIASVPAGIVVGTPIAIVRKTKSQYISCVKEYKKDSNAYKFWGAGCSAPVAVVAGLIKGTVYGARNAVHYSIDKPFSKDSFSLGTLEDDLCAKESAEVNLQPHSDKPELQPWGTR